MTMDIGAPICDDCKAVRPGFCPRCTYLMTNMRRWRKVAKILHGENCHHKERAAMGACDKYIETIYQALVNDESWDK